MITLDVPDYCQNCLYFNPRVSSNILWADNEPALVEHVVTCTESYRCKYLRQHLKENDV